MEHKWPRLAKVKYQIRTKNLTVFKFSNKMKIITTNAKIEKLVSETQQRVYGKTYTYTAYDSVIVNKAIQWVKGSYFNKWHWNNRMSIKKETHPPFFFTPHKKFIPDISLP